MAAGAPTPPHDTTNNDHDTHEIPYSPTFEDSLIPAVLELPNTTASPGLRIITEDSAEQPRPGISILASDPSLQNLPSIPHSDLPLTLTDPRRIYASVLPGVKLTHPNGLFEGGAGPSPSTSAELEQIGFAEDFFGRNPGLSTPVDLERAVQREVDENVKDLKGRLRERKRGTEKNEGVERELKALADQHSMELKIQKRMAEEQREKREAREKRARERQGG